MQNFMTEPKDYGLADRLTLRIFIVVGFKGGFTERRKRGYGCGSVCHFGMRKRLNNNNGGFLGRN